VWTIDGSTDGSREILARLQEEHQNARAFLQPRNLGKGAALRRGIQEATGDFVLRYRAAAGWRRVRLILQKARSETPGGDNSNIRPPDVNGSVMQNEAKVEAQKRRTGPLYFLKRLGIFVIGVIVCNYIFEYGIDIKDPAALEQLSSLAIMFGLAGFLFSVITGRSRTLKYTWLVALASYLSLFLWFAAFRAR
jgi:glycosyltransferase involved in cell wall biosynthesis